MNNQFNRSFEVPLKQFWCRSFQDSNSCGIHLKVFALFFSSAAAAPSSSEGQKKGDSLMFIIIGCLVAVTMVVAFIGGLCYIGRTHQQIYSKLPSEFPDWLTELMKLHVLAVLVVVISVARISRSPPNCVSWMNEWLNENSYIVCSCSVGCGYISHTHQQICFKLPSEFPEWMTIYTWGIEHYTQNLACSCGVGCGYVSRTHQQVCLKHPSGSGVMFVVAASIVHTTRSIPNCPESLLWLHQMHTPVDMCRLTSNKNTIHQKLLIYCDVFIGELRWWVDA